MCEVLRTRYLTRQRRTVASVYREIARECRVRGLRVPSRGTMLRRIARLDPVKTVTAREGRDAARARRSAGGTSPEVTGLLEQVQADHTPVDVIVVDEKHRLPAGRPYLTVAIDVCSRCVLGMVVTLEAPSATSVGLCLAHAAAGKRPWLERLEAEAVWPMSGKPRELYLDNAADFKSEALRRGCEQHGIPLRYRPPGQPHFGGIIERLIGTMMQMVHELPGTTISSTADHGGQRDRVPSQLPALAQPGQLPRPGHHHQHLISVQPAHREQQRPRRRPIGPLQIIDDRQHHPPELAEPADQLGTDRQRVHPAGQNRGQQPRRAAPRPAGAGHQLTHDAVRQQQLGLIAAGAQHRRAGQPRREPRQQGRLADPGVALDQHHLRLAAAGRRGPPTPPPPARPAHPPARRTPPRQQPRQQAATSGQKWSPFASRS